MWIVTFALSVTIFEIFVHNTQNGSRLNVTITSLFTMLNIITIVTCILSVSACKILPIGIFNIFWNSISPITSLDSNLYDLHFSKKCLIYLKIVCSVIEAYTKIVNTYTLIRYHKTIWNTLHLAYISSHHILMRLLRPIHLCCKLIQSSTTTYS